jgi:hypothetical protein
MTGARKNLQIPIFKAIAKNMRPEGWRLNYVNLPPTAEIQK